MIDFDKAIEYVRELIYTIISWSYEHPEELILLWVSIGLLIVLVLIIGTIYEQEKDKRKQLTLNQTTKRV